MHLKFPLPAGYFPTFELPPDETLAFKELVTDLVRATRREHDALVQDGQRHVDARKWKLAKTKDRLHIYKRRSEYGATAIGLTGHTQRSGSSLSDSYDPSASVRRSGSESSSNGFSQSSAGHVRSRGSSSQSNGSSHSSSRRASLDGLDESSSTGLHRRLLEPTLLATGVIDGRVDDLVYGFHEPTADATKTTAALLGDDQLIDTVVLHTIKASKTTFLGLKWKLCRTPGGNRDMCFLEYVGVANDARGERYGFKILESVSLRNCPVFDDNSIIRTNVSFQYLFRESGTPGLVDVYMQGAFDSSSDAVTAGGVGDARSTMEMLMEVEHCVAVAESKKLADLVAKQALAPPQPKLNGSQCSLCRAKPGLLSSHLLCQGCGAVICTKCRMKKVVVVVKRGSASKSKVSCCKICLVSAKETSPFEGEPISTPPPLPLRALQKKSSASSMMTASRSGLGSAALDQGRVDRLPRAKQLDRQTTDDSLADTEFSGSMQSWQSSSVSSSYYSDRDDSYTSVPTYSSPEGQHTLVPSKMPMVAESPRAYSHSHSHSAYKGQQHAVAMYNQYNRAPPPMRPTVTPDQHRIGLYNQMVELQIKAERAHSLASQNAAMMQQRQ